MTAPSPKQSAEATSLMAEAQGLGARIKTRDGKLKVSAPAPLPSELVDRLRHHKPELLEYLRRESEAAEWRVWVRDRFKHRRSLADVDEDGSQVRRYTRPEAHRIVMGEAVNRWHFRHATLRPHACAGCGKAIGGDDALVLPDGAKTHFGCLTAYGGGWQRQAEHALAELGVAS